MKKIYKLIILTIFSSVLYTSCDLEEDPPYLSNDSVYSDVVTADVALNGILSSVAGYNYYGSEFHGAALHMTGLFYPGKKSDRLNIGILQPTSTQNYPTNFWKGCYTTIARANDFIANTSADSEDATMNNIIGIAYFLRAHTYFNLVRHYGGVPLYAEPASSETLHKERASIDDVYSLIIADAEKAKNLMFDASGQKGRSGRPGKYAVNMLLAKVYMALAGNDNGSPNWQKAYDEAIQVVGEYSLVPNYAELWDDESTANNNSESIFEIQFNLENSSSLTKYFSESKAYPGKGWKRFRPNPEIIDMHMAKYPNDPRINLTFKTSYIDYKKGKTVLMYPENPNRKKDTEGFPYLYKYFIKDLSATSDITNFNYVQYRYADLLLMLAEIENEIGKSNDAHAHVNEVLARARNTGGGTVEPADWAGLDQDEFRTAIMREYQYELLGEGQDFFNTHRRGYDWFKTNFIDVHNNREGFKSFDLVYPDHIRAMFLPIPSDEISRNQKINASDQNPGY